MSQNFKDGTFQEKVVAAGLSCISECRKGCLEAEGEYKNSAWIEVLKKMLRGKRKAKGFAGELF